MSHPNDTVILNVDDTEVARYTKTRSLQHAGFRVVEATTGREALEKVQDLRPALVMLDVRLPDINGIEVCKRIKAQWPTTMVLQTSATFVSAADRTRGLEGGADAYLTQPIEPPELVAAVRALLRLHAAEEATRALNETLEQRIAERTAELNQANTRLIEQIRQRERAEAALVQSQKMEAVGQLTGAMAHDFNNLLASIVGYVHLVKRKADSPEIRAFAEKALAAADRGGKLTARLLAFARTERLVNEAVDIRTLIDGMTDWLTQSAGRTVTLEVELAEGELIAITDSNQLELALLNLVINARDAMPNGGRIVVRAATEALSDADGALGPGEYVRIDVEDNGHGMSPETASRAFDAFFTTKAVGRGTGLGLSQVYNLARQSNGTARIDSALGRGTMVSMWLERGDAARLADAGADAGPPIAGEGEYVLVVDDEADIRQTLSQMLSDNGYRVAAAVDGAQALQMCTAEMPDLVLLDFAMPGLTGGDVAKQLRTLAPQLPILFLSGHADLEALEAAAAGVQLLRKPFKATELYAAARRAVLLGKVSKA